MCEERERSPPQFETQSSSLTVFWSQSVHSSHCLDTHIPSDNVVCHSYNAWACPSCNNTHQGSLRVRAHPRTDTHHSDSTLPHSSQGRSLVRLHNCLLSHENDCFCVVCCCSSSLSPMCVYVCISGVCVCVSIP